MHPRRVFGVAAVCASAVPAGTIDSSSGSASVTPAPRRNVRRERCFFVMNVTARVPPSYRFIWNGTLLTMPATSDENR